MIRNLDVEDGLVNGMFGTIADSHRHQRLKGNRKINSTQTGQSHS